MWLLVKNSADSTCKPFALPLKDGRLTVGRGPKCDLILSDRFVSQRHIVVSKKGKKLEFRDLGSSRGTLLNGAETPGGALMPDDCLRLGRVELTVLAGPPQFTTDTGSKQPEPQPVAVSIPAAGTERAGDWQPFRAFLDKLRRSSHPKDLLERLLLGCVELLGAERGFVLLEERGKGKLIPVASHFIADTEAFVAISSTVYKKAIESEHVVFIENTLEDKECSTAQSLIEEGVPRSIVCSPLKADGPPFGVIYIDKPQAVSAFDPGHIQLFETITGLAGELVAAQRTRETLIAAQGRIDALNTLVWGEENLILGESDTSQELHRLLEMAAEQDVSVLITGETGTGKEMVARALHQLSSRAHGPFIPVNCAALPRDIIEAELFGAEKGAFTGAVDRRIGRFELANGGTLFLDEVGELPLDVQVKLLRVLQERSITRLGGSEPIPLDFRLVCATNRDLEAAVREGEVRSDFFYRVNVFRIHLKPLCQRPEDIKPLAKAFLNLFKNRFGKVLKGFSPEAERLILSYLWPGNIRELKNAVERAVVLETSEFIQPNSLPLSTGPVEAGADTLAERRLVGGLPTGYDKAKEIFDRAFLRRSFELNNANIAAIARETGLTRPTVYKWLEKLGIADKAQDSAKP